MNSLLTSKKMLPYIFWLFSAAFFLYQFIFRTGFAYLGEDIMAHFKVGSSELGSMLAATSIAYAIMQIPSGILLDRIGIRLGLSFAIFIFSLGLVLIGYTENINVALFARILMGAGAAFSFVGLGKLCYTWFSARLLGPLLSSTVFIGAIGAANSIYIIDTLKTGFGFGISLILFGLIGIAFAILFLFTVRDKHEVSATQPQTHRSLISDIKTIITNRNILFVTLWVSCIYLPVSILPDAYSTLASEVMYGVSSKVAALSFNTFYYGMAFGSLFYSAIALRVKTVRPILIWQGISTLIGLHILIHHPNLCSYDVNGVPFFLIIYGFIGFNLSGVSLAFALALSYVKKEISGIIISFINTVCMVFSALGQKVIGVLLNLHTNEQGMINHAQVKIVFQNSLNLLLVCILLAVIASFLIKESEA